MIRPMIALRPRLLLVYAPQAPVQLAHQIRNPLRHRPRDFSLRSEFPAQCPLYFADDAVLAC
jgi:hypothetical protein